MTSLTVTSQMAAWTRDLARYFHDGYQPIAMIFYRVGSRTPVHVYFNLAVVTGFAGKPDAPLPDPRQTLGMVTHKLAQAGEGAEMPVAVMLAAPTTYELSLCYWPSGLRQSGLDKQQVAQLARDAYTTFSREIHDRSKVDWLSEWTPTRVH